MKKYRLKISIPIFVLIIAVIIGYIWRSNETKINYEISKIINSYEKEELKKLPHYDPCLKSDKREHKLSLGEVKFLAECFIIENGYTDLPPSTDKSKLKAESVWSGLDKHGMQRRHDSLYRQAYSINSYPEHWSVTFRCKSQTDGIFVQGGTVYKIGRSLTMDSYGNNIHMNHQDVLLDYFPLSQAVILLKDAVGELKLGRQNPKREKN